MWSHSSLGAWDTIFLQNILNQIKVWTGIEKHIFWTYTGVRKSKSIGWNLKSKIWNLSSGWKKSLEFVNSSRALTTFNIAES